MPCMAGMGGPTFEDQMLGALGDVQKPFGFGFLLKNRFPVGKSLRMAWPRVVVGPGCGRVQVAEEGDAIKVEGLALEPVGP